MLENFSWGFSSLKTLSSSFNDIEKSLEVITFSLWVIFTFNEQKITWTCSLEKKCPKSQSSWIKINIFLKRGKKMAYYKY